MKKSALCLSGHLRTFKNTFKSIKNNIIDPLNCDVFIHTWDVIGAPTGKNPGDIEHENIQTIDCLAEIESLFNHKAIHIEDQKPKLDELINETKDIIVPIDERQFIMKHIGFHVSMFYSSYMSNYLRCNYEFQNDIKYDLVIRCRPDLFLNSKLDWDMFTNPNKLYVPEIATYTENGINDQLAVGHPNLIDKYCDIYNHIINYYRNHVCVARPEVMIKYHLDRCNIPIEMLNINYDIYRLDGAILRQYKWKAEWMPGNFLKSVTK